MWSDAEGFEVNHVCERDFTGSFLITTIDRHFDEVLKVYATLGGPLTEQEAQRLHNIGYGKDPRKRLFEFVKDWN